MKITYSSGNDTQFEYRTGKIIRKHSSEYFIPNIIDTLLLNNQGLVITELSGNIIREYTPGRMTDKVIYHNSTGEPVLALDYKVSDGNTTSCDAWELDGANLQLTITYEYEYFTNTYNTIGVENRGMAFYGKQDQDLVGVSKMITHRLNEQEEVNYLYVQDTKNRVVKMRTDNNPDNVYDTFTYYD
jgi:hypothetical protein